MVPINIWVHWLSLDLGVVTPSGIRLGNITITMLPSWAIAKFRNHCPYFLDKVLLAWGHLSWSVGCFVGVGK